MTATNIDNRRMIFPLLSRNAYGTIVGPRPNTVNASRLGGIKIFLNVAHKPHPALWQRPGQGRRQDVWSVRVGGSSGLGFVADGLAIGLSALVPFAIVALIGIIEFYAAY